MSDNELPSRAKELVKCFTEFPERVQYYLDATDWGDTESLEHIAWISQLCAPTYDDVVTLVEDPASVYTHPSFIRLLYRDDTYKDLRNRNVRLVGALETASPRVVVEEFFNYLAELSAEDRARSFLLLASEISSNETDQGEDEERIEWLNTIVESFTTSPRALRPQLLLAASIIGHKPMVTMLLRDIATDDDPAPNIDAVEAECLIEAAVNQHFQIVKELLDGGRFSNGNETRWDAVVQALEVSCTNGAVDITDVLLPHYLSYCSVISACGVHHPRLLRLALSNWHFEIVEMLLECDPRGTLCNMMELIDTLREEVAQSAQDLAAAAEAAASAGILSIVVGEENDNMGDLIMWNAAALARGVSSANNTLVKFLVSHVGICPEALEAALETAQESGNGELVEIISNQLQKTTDRFVEEESEEGTEDEMLNSPHSDNSDEESTETQIDSGEQSLSGSIDKSWPNEPQDTRLDHTSSDDGVRSTIVPDDVPDTVRSQSTTNIALRVASFKEVERMVSAATQAIRDDSLSHYTEADDADIDATRDDLLSYLTGPEDVCMDATLDNLLSPSAKLGNIDTEDTKDIVFGHSTKVDAEINVMDQAEEIHKVEPEATQNDVLGHAKEVGDMETDALPALASDAQTRLQQFDDTRELVLLRQFSSNTVEQVLYEGKLAMGQHMMKEKDDTAALQEIEPMSNGNMCEVDDDDAPDEILVQIPIVERFQDCQNESVSPNSSEVDMGSAVREGADNRHIEPCQDSTGTDRVGDTATVDEAVVPQPSIPQSSVVALILYDIVYEDGEEETCVPREFIQLTQTGSVETVRVPWGEEFATIQSLKRFAAQHSDVLRAYIETQLRELDGPLSSNSPRKSHSPRLKTMSTHSGADQARGSLLLMKDLAFLLQHRLAPFFDTIVPVVMPTVFNTEKRFLCETATEVLDAIILHCSGRKLALVFLQLGETYSKHEDLRLYNLASIYVEKCIRSWSKAEFNSLNSSKSSARLLTLLAKTLMSKSAPVRISAQKTFRHLRDELGTRSFESVLRVHISPDLEALVLKECGDASMPSSGRKSSTRPHQRGGDTQSSTSPTIVQSSLSILQRMLLQRQNRVLPAQM
ncbi:Mannitol dehydrogenase [Phytophthora cinnamomi]|uniref:Mannitol dehydrogenase n=1 Tax=Phytophthora cinnamomi TaxID=4785 RepID=UPI00355A51C7|nr:Mannitol dehydrogenase [Phytophthora cinnamomi]